MHHLKNFPVSPSLQHNPHYILHHFPYFVLPNLTTSHKYWIYQTICQANPLKFIIKLYTDHKNLCVKHATHQKAESLRAASLSKLGNIVNNKSVFNTKYAEFSTNW